MMNNMKNDEKQRTLVGEPYEKDGNMMETAEEWGVEGGTRGSPQTN